MSYYADHHQSGEEIRPGDRIRWAGRPGHVVFVVGSPDVPQEWAGQMDWFREEYGGGFMVEVQGAGLALTARRWPRGVVVC
jgi:hypothetical protein